MSAKTEGIDSLRIIYKYNENPAEPTIVGTSILNKEHLSKDGTWLFTIPLEYDQFVELVLPSPIEDTFYFSTYEHSGENFYHLALYPPVVPPSEEPRNIMIVIDFNRFNTRDFDGEFMLSYLKETLQQAFSELDSINLLIAYEDILLGSEEWVSCSIENLDQLFAKMMQRSFPSYSNFQPLMTRAAQFINSQKGSSEVFFFTNTNEIGLGTSDKEQLADDIIYMFRHGTKLHFIDLENKSGLIYHYNQNTNSYYYETQLASFFGKMAYATAGNLYHLRYYSIKTILGALFYEEISHFESVEVQLRLNSGYAHSKHLMALNEGYYPLHFPIMQVGKFDGQLPLDITVLGKIRTTKVTDNITITKEDVTPGTPHIVTSWYGDHIRELLRYPYNPLTVNDIINLSIEQRILTPYSGFLIFYPDEQHGFCEDCIDETELTKVKMAKTQNDSVSVELEAFPNPFNSSVNIKFHIPAETDIKQFDLAIYNILGQRVRKLDLSNSADYSNGIIHWSGLNDAGTSVSSGVYFVLLKGPEVHKSLKLILMR